MYRIILITVFFLFHTLTMASEILELSGEIRIPLPDDWIVAGDSAGYPFQIINSEETAELLIFKSQITEENKIKNKEELKLSVDQIIEDIILTLPEGQYHTNTGEIEGNRVSFTIEFISRDTINQDNVYHRLKGILYNHPAGHQLLFTLWGKANSDAKELLREEVLFLQDNFTYLGESEDMILIEQKPFDWRIFFVLGIMFIFLLFFFKRKSQRQTIQFSEDSHFWRCECGRQNHNNNPNCRRCGRENPSAISS